MSSHSMYSKLAQVSILRTRSEDSLDLYPHLQAKTRPQHGCKSLETAKSEVTYNSATHVALPAEGQEEEVGEIFGEILSRSCSRSSGCSLGSRIERQSSGLERTVKRAFSLRRSSSVSEGYCRIHHQSDFPTDHDGKASSSAKAKRTKKKRGKLLKACRSFFGF